MSEHQPKGNADDDPESFMTLASPGGEAAKQPATDPDEPDFSRLRMAIASLDAAFLAEDSGGA